MSCKREPPLCLYNACPGWRNSLFDLKLNALFQFWGGNLKIILYTLGTKNQTDVFKNDERNALTFIVLLLTFQCVIWCEFRNTSETEIVHKQTFLSTCELNFFLNHCSHCQRRSLSLCKHQYFWYMWPGKKQYFNIGYNLNLFQNVLKLSTRTFPIKHLKYPDESIAQYSNRECIFDLIWAHF